MLKILTYTFLALVLGSQIPCLAGDNFGKELLRGVTDTGKSKLDKSIDKAVGKMTGTGTGTAGAAANKVTGAADKAGATAGATAGTKAGTSAASTAAKPTEKPATLTKQAEDLAKAYGEKYRGRGEQELTKLMMPKKLK
jgi:hypothetical protein